MGKIILNEVGSPVQIRVKRGVSKKTGNEYDYLDLTIGDYNNRVFFSSPLEKKEIERVLAKGETGILDE